MLCMQAAVCRSTPTHAHGRPHACRAPSTKVDVSTSAVWVQVVLTDVPVDYTDGSNYGSGFKSADDDFQPWVLPLYAIFGYVKETQLSSRLTFSSTFLAPLMLWSYMLTVQARRLTNQRTGPAR